MTEFEESIVEELKAQIGDDFEYRVNIDENDIDNYLVFIGSKHPEEQKDEHVWYSDIVATKLIRMAIKEKHPFLYRLFKKQLED